MVHIIVEDEPKCAPLLGMLTPIMPPKAQKKKDEYMRFEKALCLNHKAEKFEPSKFVPRDNCTYSLSGSAPGLILQDNGTYSNGTAPGLIPQDNGTYSNGTAPGLIPQDDGTYSSGIAPNLSPQDDGTYSISGTTPTLIGLVEVMLFAATAFNLA